MENGQPHSGEIDELERQLDALKAEVAESYQREAVAAARLAAFDERARMAKRAEQDRRAAAVEFTRAAFSGNVMAARIAALKLRKD